jgi:hypothetical protein
MYARGLPDGQPDYYDMQVRYAIGDLVHLYLIIFIRIHVQQYSRTKRLPRKSRVHSIGHMYERTQPSPCIMHLVHCQAATSLY